MTEKRAITRQSLGDLTLPPTVRALSGAVFDPSAKRWAFHDGLHSISVNFERLRGCATDELIAATKFPLLWYAENTEATTVVSQFDLMRRLLESISDAQGKPVSVIDAPLLANFRASLTSDTEWRLGALSAFIKKWNSLGVPGVTNAAVRFLKIFASKGTARAQQS